MKQYSQNLDLHLGIIESKSGGGVASARVKKIEEGRERNGCRCDKWEEELGYGVES